MTRQVFRSVSALAVLLICCPLAMAQTTRFDGPWKVVLTCPPHNEEDDDAKGYTHRFSGSVVEGELSATHGKEGEPGWHLLHGRIKPNGDANLRLEGIVNSPKHAINGAQRGKVYSYRVKARFDDRSGAGQRATGRECSFAFSRD
jgi:hypothetical protein